MSNLSGKYLYHGTLRKMATGFPNKAGGSWFATDPLQSILHAVQHSGSYNTKTPYLYIYKVIKTPKIIKFNTSSNFNKFAINSGFQLEKKQKTFAFSGENYSIARKLCTNGVYDGWWFPVDQTQVVLCNPSRFLKFVKVLKINRPAKGWMNISFKRGMFKKTNLNKFSTVPVKLNNVININQPSPNHMYLAQNRGDMEKLYDPNGSPVNFNKNTRAFKYRGKSYRLAGSFTLGPMRPNKAKVMANRIKARTGIEYNSNAIKEVSYQNKSNIVPLMKKRELLEQNYYKRLIPRRKNNVNINSSSLY
ncbi:hypothetical protein [Yellowstone lake phycodnavirus 3]|uniref:hypothetical protein n=1 Tax=Yellowstone lake phycodnavirus 3 TaxID=1586715 RepID=UPI0006EB8493|nr:hypothetical protein AR677_gp233 [Yellowstone lake phycodnavirus 3]BAT22732.1 hypothetical protein [Yellowstone lake phycodnavirus 3]